MAQEIDDIDVTKPYEDTLSIEALRREVRQCWDFEHALTVALRDLPEMPAPLVLLRLGQAAKYPEDHETGKRLQTERRDLSIPFKHECEGGAGLWFRMRNAMLPPEA